MKRGKKKGKINEMKKVKLYDQTFDNASPA